MINITENLFNNGFIDDKDNLKLQQIQKNIINIYDFISEKTRIDLSKTCVE